MIATATPTAHLSFSQLRTFCTCPRRWFYEKVAQVTPERVPASLAFGAAVHDAAEAVHIAAMAGEPFDAAAVFSRSWSAFTAPGSVPLAVEDDEAEGLETRGRALAALYRPPPGIVAVEQVVTVDLDPGIPPLVGYIDVVYQTDDGLVVADVKTSSTRILSDTEMLAAQVAVYGLAIPAVRSEAIVLFKGKSPAQTTQMVEPWPESRLRTWAVEIHAAMAAGVRFANRSRNCRTCQFRDRCTADG